MFHLDDHDRNNCNDITTIKARESSSLLWIYQISKTENKMKKKKKNRYRKTVGQL